MTTQFSILMVSLFIMRRKQNVIYVRKHLPKIIWTDPKTKTVVALTEEECKELATLRAAQPEADLNAVREVRNQKLAETDWVVIKEREEGGSVSNFADWKTYRQALRDITDSATSLNDVTWPTKPE